MAGNTCKRKPKHILAFIPVVVKHMNNSYGDYYKGTCSCGWLSDPHFIHATNAISWAKAHHPASVAQ